MDCPIRFSCNGKQVVWSLPPFLRLSEAAFLKGGAKCLSMVLHVSSATNIWRAALSAANYLLSRVTPCYGAGAL